MSFGQGITAGAVALALLAIATAAWSQPSDELPRRAALGVALAVNDADAVSVSGIAEGSAAAAAEESTVARRTRGRNRRRMGRGTEMKGLVITHSPIVRGYIDPV